MRPIHAITLCLGLLAVPVRSQATEASAQKGGAERLEALLTELRGTSAAVWDARLVAMKESREQALAAAKAALELAAAKRKEAEQRDATAKTIDTEAERVAQLRALAATLKFRDAGRNGDPARLDQLLQELSQVTAESWDARVRAVGEAAAREREAGRQLREAADKAEAEAKARQTAADAIAQESEAVEKLRAALAGLREAAPKPAETAPPPAPPKPAEPAKDPAPTKQESASPPAMAPMAKTEAKSDERLVTYADDVFPIFEENCITCHERGETSGGLDLSSHATALQGGGSGRTIRPGNPDASRLYLLVSHKEKPTMPPDEPRIAGELIETIRLWIAQGAPKDRAEAEHLAGERVVAKAKADATAEATQRARTQVESVMPDATRLLGKHAAAHSPALRAIAVAPAAPLIATSGIGQVLLLSADDLHELGALDFPFGQVERLVFSADGRRLLAAGGRPGRSGAAVLYDIATATALRTFAEQHDVVIGADLSPDGTLVAVGGTRRKVEVVQVDDGSAVWDGAHDDWVTDVRFSPDGTMLASADRTGRVMVREAQSGREVQALSVGEGAVDALAFSPDSTLLATGGADRTLRVFRMSDGSQSFSQKVHTERITALCWYADRSLLSAGADGRVWQWRSDGNRERDLPRLDEWIYGLCASADGKRCFLGDWIGRLSMVDLTARKIAAQVAPLIVAQ
ncbi:MAG: c-type cytochrome domain-containing protein [Planctomycetota bacterium]